MAEGDDLIRFCGQQNVLGRRFLVECSRRQTFAIERTGVWLCDDHITNTYNLIVRVLILNQTNTALAQSPRQINGTFDGPPLRSDASNTGKRESNTVFQVKRARCDDLARVQFSLKRLTRYELVGAKLKGRSNHQACSLFRISEGEIAHCERAESQCCIGRDIHFHMKTTGGLHLNFQHLDPSPRSTVVESEKSVK